MQASSFDNLLLWLNQDRNLAAQEYEEMRLKLVKYFEVHQCYHPGECFDKTMDIISNKLDEGNIIHDSKGDIIQNKGYYVFGVAKNVLKKYQKEQTKAPKPIADDDQLTSDETDSDLSHENEAEHEKHCRELCLNRLKLFRDDWDLICEYVSNEAGVLTRLRRRKMAQMLNLSQNALMIKIHRIRDKFWQEYQICLNECLKR